MVGMKKSRVPIYIQIWLEKNKQGGPHKLIAELVLVDWELIFTHDERERKEIGNSRSNPRKGQLISTYNWILQSKKEGQLI